MTSIDLPERFYRLLYFSPRPEDDERVCVGLIVRDGKNTYLDYDEKLEKAHCFAPDYTTESLTFVLGEIRDRVRQAALEGKIAEFSPQFRLSSPRALLQPVDERVRSVLKHRYLLKLRSPEHRRRERGPGRKIDQFLDERFHLTPNMVRRQATADDVFGSPLARDLPKDLIPKPVSRALISDSEICLIDGVDLHLKSPDLLVHKINRISHTFWQYKQAEQMFPLTRRRRLFKAALVFDGKTSEVEASLRWRLDYAFHQFEKEADITVKAGSGEQEAELRNELVKLLRGSDALLP